MFPIKRGKINLYLIWSDSLGAKSFSFFVETPDIKLLVDPGAAVMQPSYPLSVYRKRKLKKEAINKILEYAEKATHIFISHYHYDHHLRPSVIKKNFYKDKILFIKNPNKFINFSQSKRARMFLKEILKKHELKESEEVNINFIEKQIKKALSMSYGDYNTRKKELIEKGRKWLLKMKKFWEKSKWMKEYKGKDIKVLFCDGKTFKIGKTELKFTEPIFHGLEYDRIGWVIGIVIKHGKNKILYTSDIQGPQIEDYADWIIKENPDIILLDGFPLYLMGYITNKINFERAKRNLIKILEKTKSNPVIFDHHHLRNEKHIIHYREIYENFKNRIFTYAELMGKKPLILQLKNI